MKEKIKMIMLYVKKVFNSKNYIIFKMIYLERHI